MEHQINNEFINTCEQLLEILHHLDIIHIPYIQKKVIEELLHKLEDKQLSETEKLIANDIQWYRKKALVDNTIYSLIQNINDDEDRIHPLVSLFIDGLRNTSLEDLETIKRFTNKAKVLELMKPHIQAGIQEMYQDSDINLRYTIQGQSWKEDTIQQGKEKFPILGNNKFRILDKSEIYDEIEKNFIHKGIEHISDLIIQAQEKRYESFSGSGELIDDAALGIKDLFEHKIIDIIYPAIAQEYIRDLRASQAERKIKSSNIPQGKEEKPQESTREKKVSEKILWYEDQRIHTQKLLEQYIPTSSRQKEAIRYILRLYRNGKEIRIQDLQDKYNLPDEVFSEEMIHEVKKIGIHLINGVHKEKITEDKEADPEQLQDDKKTCDNTPELCFQDTIIHEIKSNDIPSTQWWVEILQKAGYTIDNKRKFIKQFDKLYKTDKQKQSFYQDMVKHIFTIKSKTNASNGEGYRSIDLEEKNRILFAQKGIIDGIYNHNDYIRRLNNLGKGK